jgi:VIT1/CCC1 family predicted Fe2+/Mn2+ transporter
MTEHRAYDRIAGLVKEPANAGVLRKIAKEERRHAEFWSRYTATQVRPRRFVAAFYLALARILGLTFGLKLMERGEQRARINYERILQAIPEGRPVYEEEEHHERQLLDLIQEERLSYMGSVVLGLNDALVELTGALAGLTLALRKTSLIAVVGLITGIAASLSMAASEYLSQKSEGKAAKALTSALYTGVAYIGTVLLLVLPYLLLDSVALALGITLAVAIMVIAAFNFYLSVARDLAFGRRFAEMSLLSLGVALFSFGLGYVIRSVFGVEA